MRTCIPAIIALVFTTHQAGCHKADNGAPVAPPVTDHLVEFICTTSTSADLMGVAVRINDSTASIPVEGHSWNSVAKLRTGTNVGLTCSGASISRSVVTVETTIKLDNILWKSAAATDTFTVKASCSGVVP